MNPLNIEATENSPLVSLDPASLNFLIAGESRPENAGKFYEPIVQWFKQFHDDQVWSKSPNGNVTFEFKLEYFNSTSAKYLLDILKLVDMCSSAGCPITVKWHYDQRDEDMKESGEEFSQLINVNFEFISN